MVDMALIQATNLPPAKAEFSLTPAAVEMMEAALEQSALIARVENGAQNSDAAQAQAALQHVSKLIEKARLAITKPLLDAQRAIKAFADEKRKELDLENRRISKLIGDFQALELAKVRAAEAAKRQEQERLEKERQEALAKAKSHDELDKVQQEFNDRAKIEADANPTPMPTRAEGQRVTTDWEVKRINEHVLAKARPDLVRRIEFDMRALKEELKRGVKLPGVEAEEVVKAGVTLRTGKAIEV